MTKKIKDYLIGSDFELFLAYEDTKEIISAEGIVPGTKSEPFVFDPSNRFFSSSLDNILAEATIPPVNDLKAWVAAIEKSNKFLKDICPAGIVPLHKAAARVDDKWLQSENAKLMGCDVDYCVWTRSPNIKPDAMDNLRSTGMHVHVGWPDPVMNQIEALVKALDLHLSVPAVLIEPSSERKKLYGKAGCFRMPEHGVEYRSLSGYFAKDPEISGWVFNNTVKAIQFINDGRIEEILSVGDQIQEAINTNNVTIAANLMNQFELNYI